MREKKLERLQVVVGHAIALGIHPAELPQGQGVALTGRVFEGAGGAFLVTGIVFAHAGPQGLPAER